MHLIVPPRIVACTYTFLGLKSLFASTDGAMPWRAEHQRRTLIYPYAPRYQARVPSIYEVSYPSYVQNMTPDQQTVLRAPGSA